MVGAFYLSQDACARHRMQRGGVCCARMHGEKRLGRIFADCSGAFAADLFGADQDMDGAAWLCADFGRDHSAEDGRVKRRGMMGCMWSSLLLGNKKAGRRNSAGSFIRIRIFVAASRNLGKRAQTPIRSRARLCRSAGNGCKRTCAWACR